MHLNWDLVAHTRSGQGTIGCGRKHVKNRPHSGKPETSHNVLNPMLKAENSISTVKAKYACELNTLWDINNVLRVYSMATIESRPNVLSPKLTLYVVVSSWSTVGPSRLLASRAFLGSAFPALFGGFGVTLHVCSTLREHSLGSERTASTSLCAWCGGGLRTRRQGEELGAVNTKETLRSE